MFRSSEVWSTCQSCDTQLIMQALGKQNDFCEVDKPERYYRRQQ